MHRGSLITTLLVAATALAGCAGGGLEPGDVELQLTGADQMQLFSLPAQPETEPGDHGIVSAVVTIKEIDAKVAGTWTPLATAAQTIDLLQLDNKTISSLGIVKLPSGHVSELRFVLDEVGAYVVLKTGVKKPLEVPNNGIVKIDGKLDLDSCAAGIVILDFDPHIKIEHEGCSKIEYELTCGAHIKTEEIHGACGGGGNGGGGGGGGGGNGGGGGGSTACDNVVCMMGQICVVQNGLPSCMDTCTSLVCTPPDVCVLVSGTPACVNPGH